MFGIAKDIRSEVRECTPDLLNAALDSAHVARVCAEIEDALEKCRRGEITKEEYETIKSELKKKLPIITFHAMFKNGRRKNEDAIPSGFSIYDLDYIEDPRGRWAEIEPRKEELGIKLSHISPSLRGLRLVFRRPPLAPPAGGESPANGVMSLAESQAWMAQQLGDSQYDACVKDYARCSFVVPREYVLWLDEEGLFSPQSTQSSTKSDNLVIFRTESSTTRQSEAK
ncbi:MAG: BT4734/BF3469 family protein, partial [Bacteroidaceae bacterium]|nr:BT4734/BF3469 family protein [Bacteroidaceae bacterium]